MDPPAASVEKTNGTNGNHDDTVNKTEELLDESDQTVRVPRVHAKVLNIERDPAKVPLNFSDYLNDTADSEVPEEPASVAIAPSVPTSVIAKAPAPEQPSVEIPKNLLEGEPEKEQEKVTVADLVEQAEEEKEKEEKEEKAEEETEIKGPEVDPPTQEAVATPVKKSLAEDWEEEGDEEVEEEPTETKKESKDISMAEKEVTSAAAESVEDSTPVRKSGRAPKPTEKLLEGKQQEKLKVTEDDDDDEEEEDEESVDAIAAELEKGGEGEHKSKSAKKAGKSPKKGAAKAEKEEDWVNLIFGENGEKVTEKGKKLGEKGKEEGDDDKEGDELPDAEEFLMEQTQFFTKGQASAKKGGRPKKKDLDEKMDGVAKLGSNMYFYTGPGMNPAGESSDEEGDVKVKDKSESARKSRRANKGKNSRLERGDEVVEMPQAKAKEASLNPSWLKQAATDGGKKETPKKAMSTPTKVALPPTPKAKVAKKEEVEEEASMEESVEEDEEEIPMVKTVAAKSATGSMATDLSEEELKKLAGTTVVKGDDEYVIVVQGVQDTGLCGKYWGEMPSDGSRRRSKAPDQLQAGRGTPTSEKGSRREGSVGSTASDTPKAKKVVKVETPIPAAKATPKSTKKQVTKPERRVEAMDSSQSEEEEPKAAKGRGKKRKAEETPISSKKGRKIKGEKGEEEPEATFSDYDSAGEKGRGKRGGGGEEQGRREREESDPPVSSKQANAVANALAAGVPAGQQRSVSCVADTSTQREVVVECFAPYDDHRWVNIGKERDGMAPDAVQYARALRPPYHLLSFLRIKGHSTKGMSCTDKNTMVFVVLEGEITVILHTTQFNAKKGDSFYIPPKNYYNLINQKAREAELSLIQFQYDGPLPTVQPTNAQ